MKKQRILYFSICLVLSVIISFSLSSCVPLWKWNFTLLDGSFKTQSEDMILDFKKKTGEIIINGEKTNVDIGISHDLTEIDLTETLDNQEGERGITDQDKLLVFEVVANKDDQSISLSVIGGQWKDSFDTELVLYFKESDS